MDTIVKLARTNHRDIIFGEHKLLGLMLKYGLWPSAVGVNRILKAYRHFQDEDALGEVERLRGIEDCCRPENHDLHRERMLSEPFAQWCANAAAVAAFDPNEANVHVALDRVFAEIFRQPPSPLYGPEPDPEAEPEPPRAPADAAGLMQMKMAAQAVVEASVTSAADIESATEQPAAEEAPAPPRPRKRRESSTTIPRDDKAYALCLGVQERNVRLLLRLRQARQRERGEGVMRQAEMLERAGVNLLVLYETDLLGTMLGFTIDEDEFIGKHALDRRAKAYKRKGRFVIMPGERYLNRITPARETLDETRARRAQATRPRRTDRQRERRAEQSAAKAALQRRVSDIDCRQSAVWEALPYDWITVAELARIIKRTAAFEGLKGQPLVNAILKALAKEPLCQRVERDMRTGKYRQRVLFVRRKPVNSEKEGGTENVKPACHDRSIHPATSTQSNVPAAGLLI
jgi:hypothetical protein